MNKCIGDGTRSQVLPPSEWLNTFHRQKTNEQTNRQTDKQTEGHRHYICDRGSTK